MTVPKQTMLQCSTCGTPNPISLRSMIDAKNDPQGKAALLSGRINSFACQNCGTINTVSSPLLYHDPEKELLIAFVPMDVAMQRQVNEEKVIGDLMNELSRNLPKEQFRAYMFSPKRALTMQGLIEQIMEADGITKEMVEEQKGRVEILENLMKASSEEALIAKIGEVDGKIDEALFRTLSVMIQRVMADGAQQVAGHLFAIQDALLHHSSFGQNIAEEQRKLQDSLRDVSQAIEKLGDDIKKHDLLALAIQYSDDKSKLQALVTLVRPALDYEFFLSLSEKINEAADAERTKLEALRGTLQEITEEADLQMRQLVQQKVQFLQVLLTSPNYEEILQENAAIIDDNFMGVLSANIQEAQRRHDNVAESRLTAVYEAAVAVLQSQMTPELRFINELMSAESSSEMEAMVSERAGEFGIDLLEITDAVEQLFVSQGQQEAIERLNLIRVALERALT